MSRYILTISSATESTQTTYTDRSSALRGAARARKRTPDALLIVVDTKTETVIFNEVAPLAVRTLTDEPAVESAPEPDPALTAVKTPAPSERKPRGGVRPFALELFERGDEVYDIEAQATEHPMRLRIVIVGGSDEGAIGEVLGLIDWRTGVNRWVPAIAARDGAGNLLDFPRPDRRGKPVSGRSNAVAALFDLLGAVPVRS